MRDAGHSQRKENLCSGKCSPRGIFALISVMDAMRYKQNTEKGGMTLKVNKIEVKKNEIRVIPVEEGLFTLPTSPEEKPQLIGSKCPFCGTVWFPSQPICPKCYQEGTEKIALSRKDKITTFTVIRMNPPGYKGKVPYVLAEVRLPEGVTVRTQLEGVDADKPAINIGDEVEMVIEKIYEDEEGNDVVCYMFKPTWQGGKQ